MKNDNLGQVFDISGIIVIREKWEGCLFLLFDVGYFFQNFSKFSKVFRCTANPPCWIPVSVESHVLICNKLFGH